MACAFFIGLLIICFAEVASRFSETGGPFLCAITALRRKYPQHPAAFAIPGGIGLAIAVTLLSGWLIAHSSRDEIYMVGGAALLGGIISPAARFWRKR